MQPAIAGLGSRHEVACLNAKRNNNIGTGKRSPFSEYIMLENGLIQKAELSTAHRTVTYYYVSVLPSRVGDPAICGAGTSPLRIQSAVRDVLTHDFSFSFRPTILDPHR